MFLAIDLGAESGRVVRGRLRGDRLEAEEVRRFPSRPVQVGDRLTWDVEALLGESQAGIAGAGPVRSRGIAGWGVDFALLQASGSRAAPPRAYRDPLTAGILPRLFE